MTARRRSAGPPPLTVGGVTIDVFGHRAMVGDRELALTRIQFDLLVHLMAHCGRVCTRDELMADVWGYRVPVGTRTVDVHMSQLRAKLAGALEIRTVHGEGYVLDPPAV